MRQATPVSEAICPVHRFKKRCSAERLALSTKSCPRSTSISRNSDIGTGSYTKTAPSSFNAGAAAAARVRNPNARSNVFACAFKSA